GSSNISYSTAPSAANGTLTLVATPPTITSFAPAAGGLGQLVTLTGTNLTGVTSLLVNGVNATASITNNTATSLTFRVPVTTPLTGSTTVTTPNGFATSTAFTVMAAPGNALAFDGTDDYVAFGSTPAVTGLGTGDFTLEAWVYYTGGTGAQSIIRKTGDYNLYLNGNTLHAEVWPNGVGNTAWRKADGNLVLPANRWVHVAAVWTKAATTLQLYVNGVADGTGATTTGTVSGSENLTVGKSTIYTNLLTGRLDEVRIYNAALTPANLQADMLSTVSATPSNLKLYLNFDQGTPGEANTGLTTVYDLASNYAGTLTSFALASGNSSSNWVESYALVVPTATAATGVTSTDFTANWTTPAVGTITNYLLDVSTSAAFTSPISGSPFTITAGTTTRSITGLTPGSTYYYRVRADKTSVTGQGAYSVSIPVTTCALPVAVAQNANLFLSAAGAATLTATAVNNGSTA
ncbi:LamG-like jellyroll fold domain-containing protein, partial [Hymenobacter crusticola]